LLFLGALEPLQPVPEVTMMAGQGGLAEVEVGGQGAERVAGEEQLVNVLALGVAADGTGVVHE
jgi:hypothetical protein